MKEGTDTNRESACTGKERFSANVVNSVRKRYPKAAPYKCNFCGFFHLGHQKPKPRKRKWK